MLKVDIHENNKKLFDVDKEINTIHKATRRRNQKHKRHREHSLRLNELKPLRTDLKIKIEALN